LPFTSMLRRSSRNTVGGALPTSALAGDAVGERASVAAADVATADQTNVRRESIKASHKC
jgi:hypothetical protein